MSTAFERFRRSEAATGWLVVGPTALYATLLLAAPLVTILVLSFLVFNNGAVTSSFTMGNYLTAWTDPIYRFVMLRSLFVSGLVTLATVLLAYPIAYFVSFKLAPDQKSLWLFMITIPFWTSYLIRVFLWKVILGYNGVINSGLIGIGVIEKPLTAFNYSTGAIVLTLAHAYAPFAILPIFVALEKIDRALLEAGQDLGEGAFRTFLRVTLPLSMTGVVSAVMIVFIPTVGDYVTPLLIGGGKIPLIANVIQSQMLDIGNKPLGSAIAVTAMVIVAAVSLAFLAMNRRHLGANK